ncbi:MAG: hypothetical protein ACI8P0_005004 [Planctomycetaceae bacterium]|jgi:hypothetical protein
MKNIILCSDGTGNSGGICNSNVYRLFESLDLDATEVMEVMRVETEGKKEKDVGASRGFHRAGRVLRRWCRHAGE